MKPLKADTNIALPSIGTWRASAHRFEPTHVAAIEAATLSGRPLLVRGEPGLGKSQIARAIAAIHEWRLVTIVVNARTEVDDLLYSIDHVARLSDANVKQSEESLALQNYLRKGPIWRAMELGEKDFNARPNNAEDKGYYEPQEGCVLLVDEIDKAHSDIPNALLEVLDQGSFQVSETGELVKGERDRVFVVITANEERALPAAFLRRCAVLTLGLGDNPVQRLMEISAAHKEYGLLNKVDDEMQQSAAELVRHYREGVPSSEYKPGSSEYLDLLRVIDRQLEQGDISSNQVANKLEEMSTFLIKKQLRTDTIY